MTQQKRYWVCVAGPATDVELKDGADLPPRRAVVKAMEDMGLKLESYSTGWGADEGVADAIKKAWTGERVYTENEVKAVALTAIETIRNDLPFSPGHVGRAVGCISKALQDAGIILDPSTVLPTS